MAARLGVPSRAMASIRVRGDSYRVEWRLGGSKAGKSQSVTFASEAYALAAKNLAETRKHRITDDEVYRAVAGIEEDARSPIPTLADWIQQWAEKKIDIQPDTLAKYMQTLQAYVIPKLGDMRLDLIDADVVTDWVAWLSQQPQRPRTAGKVPSRVVAKRKTPAKLLSPNTVRKAHALLHQVLGAAVPRLIPGNPAAKPAGARRGNTGLPKPAKFDALFLDPTEADLILGHCSPALRDLVYVALRTGLRLGELVVLRVSDVDLDGARPCIYVRRALKADGTIGEPKSAKSRRAVSLSEAAVEVLRKVIEGRAKWALLFPAPDGGVWDKDNIRRQHWQKAVAAAQRCPDHMPPAPPKPARGPARGYRLDEVSTCDCQTRLHKTPRFHDTRHTHAAWLIAARWDIFEISRRLGHESIQTTMDIYGHLLPQGQREGLEALDKLAA